MNDNKYSYQERLKAAIDLTDYPLARLAVDAKVGINTLHRMLNEIFQIPDFQMRAISQALTHAAECFEDLTLTSGLIAELKLTERGLVFIKPSVIATINEMIEVRIADSLMTAPTYEYTAPDGEVYEFSEEELALLAEQQGVPGPPLVVKLPWEKLQIAVNGQYIELKDFSLPAPPPEFYYLVLDDRYKDDMATAFGSRRILVSPRQAHFTAASVEVNQMKSGKWRLRFEDIAQLVVPDKIAD